MTSKIASSVSSIGKISKNAAIYGIGTLIRHLTSLLMLPIYTHYLSPSDYGAIELLVMGLDLIAIFLGFRITQAMLRFYLLEEDRKKKEKVVSTVYLTVLLMSAIGVCVLHFGAKYGVVAIFGNMQYVKEFKLFSFSLISMAISAAGMVYIQARQKPVLYVAFSLFTLLLQLVGNIYFVVYRELHVLGVVYSVLLSGSITSLILSIYLLSKVGFGFDYDVFKRLTKFVYPLMLASLAGFYVAYADKYFLRIYHGLSAVGIYSLASRIGSVASLVYSTFNQSWMAARFDIYKQKNCNLIFGKVFKFVGVLLVSVWVGLSIFSQDLVYFMADESFNSASQIVPLIVAAIIMNFFVTYFNFGLLLHEKTRYLAYGAWVRAGFATLMYFIFVPEFGIFGASFGLFIANSAEAIYIYIVGRRFYDMDLEFGPLFLVFVVSVPVVVLGLNTPVGSWIDTVLRGILFCAFIIIIFLLPIWSKEERGVIIGLFLASRDYK